MFAVDGNNTSCESFVGRAGVKEVHIVHVIDAGTGHEQDWSNAVRLDRCWISSAAAWLASGSPIVMARILFWIAGLLGRRIGNSVTQASMCQEIAHKIRFLFLLSLAPFSTRQRVRLRAWLSTITRWLSSSTAQSS